MLVGALAALLGLLPWLLTGLRMPLQNLWAVETAPDAMPWVLLPYSQYLLPLLVAVLVVGAAVAGLYGRLTGARRSGGGTLLLALGVLLMHATAATHGAWLLSTGLVETPAAHLYWTALVTGTVAASVLGLVVLVLLARAPAGGAVVGASLAAVLLTPWLSGLLFPLGRVTDAPTEPVLALLNWSPALMIGMAVAVAGIGTAGRKVAALLGLLLLWLAPALFAAVNTAAGSRVLAGDPAAMWQQGRATFLATLTYAPEVVPPLVVALAVMVAGLLVRAVIVRLHRPRTGR